MFSLRRRFVFGMFLAIGGMAAGWTGETITTWVDSQGVRHFSQFPPTQEDVQQLETLELDPLPATVPLDERLEAIRSVSRELEQARLQREDARRQQASPPAEAAVPRQPPETEPDTGIRILPYPYRPPYPPRYPYPPTPPRHGHKPPPEIEQPVPHSLIPPVGGTRH